MTKKMTISGVKLSPLFDILSERGIRKHDFLASMNLESSLFESHDRKLTKEQLIRLLDTAVELSGDADLGLHIGERLTSYPNIVCYIMMNSVDLEDTITHCCRYQSIFNEENPYRLSLENGLAIFEAFSSDVSLAFFRPFSDYNLASIYRFFLQITGGALELREAKFTHQAPDDMAEYSRIFNCPVHFGNATNALIFKTEALRLPILHPNKELLTVFETHARETLAKISAPDSFSKKVSSLLLKMLQGNYPSVEDVAGKLHVSVRKLQMLLEDEGTSYKELLNAIRKELALNYLNDRHISLTEIAYLLGFSEPSAFHRAFKRWTGNTPGKYRMLQVAEE